jgi:DivIVA domain-containing protein
LTKRHILITIINERAVIVMNKNLIKLTPKDILQKEFKIDTRGFCLKEVDAYLDDIIRDYQAYDKIVSELEDENEQMRDEILNLKQEIRDLRGALEGRPQETVNNVDILRRLSQLEKIVYGKEE